jgi:hypothetical protein
MSNIKADVHSILIDLKKEEYLNDLIYAIKTISSTLSVRT